jgi:hypothetical protein
LLLLAPHLRPGIDVGAHSDEVVHTAAMGAGSGPHECREARLYMQEWVRVRVKVRVRVRVMVRARVRARVIGYRVRVRARGLGLGLGLGLG